ncbi:MAG TPA: RNA-guided endonuclease IscB [Ktedonobacterales bacterium]|jgi:5-methylcytosine-specific restriction endonuclease McrA|nr:RNA-guided endonuclease IscB [Ktedonobacterales bacterium]
MVFVVDTHLKPLSPCHSAWARRLLTARKAAVWRRYPCTIVFKRSVPDAQPQPLRAKIDPGSRVTGLVVVNDASGQVVWAGELAHRGQQVRESLLTRRAIRRARRQYHTRYRPARVSNRRRREGWLPPSLEPRISNVLTWVRRRQRFAPIAAVSQELVRFDTQLLEYPEISGVAYQQGELAGYEVREYLLEKWERRCAYCGATGVPLQVEHIVPKARGGLNRISNPTLACAACNTAKGTQTAAEFGYPEVQAQARRPLHPSAAVNTSRWALYRRLAATGLSVEVGTGGHTKWNRTARGLPKAHWIDAACVGASTPVRLHVRGIRPLAITARGHGTRQICGTNRAGIPMRHRTRQKRFFGFQTGDLLQAVLPVGFKTAGQHRGRVLVRASGSVDLATSAGACRESATALVGQSLVVMATPVPMSGEKGKRRYFLA